MKSNFKIIAYTASWCPHCIQLKPTLTQLKEWCQKQNIKYINYDADLNKDKMNNIDGFPTIKIFNISDNNSFNLNRQSINSIELHNRTFDGLKKEINDFINSNMMKGGGDNNYSFKQVYSHQSTFQNGKQINNKYDGYVKECNNGVCKIYKLNNSEIFHICYKLYTKK